MNILKTQPQFPRDSYISDALYNTSRSVNPNIKYSQGLIVGIATVMIALGWSAEDAFSYIKARLPMDYHEDCIPRPWREYL